MKGTNVCRAGMLALAAGTCALMQPTPAASTLRFPAETESQQSIWLASPTIDYKKGWSMLGTQADMIGELVKGGRVEYLVNSPSDADALRTALRARGIGNETIAAHVGFHAVAHADLWVRDYGGLFLSDGAGNAQIVDFDFDGYGYDKYANAAIRATYDFDNDLAVRVAHEIGVPVVRSTLIAEGGNLVFNGHGTVIATERGLLGRNPGWSKADVEAELARAFRVSKVIWLPRGLATDANAVEQTPYDIDGERIYNVGVNHADEMAAWVGPRTVLLPEITAAEAARGNALVKLDREILENAYRILSSASDQDGKPLTVIRAPAPDPIIVDIRPEDGIYQFLAGLHGLKGFVDGAPAKFALAASYMNFVVTDNVVLVPKFYKNGRPRALEAKDAAFKRLVESLYPGRRVAQID